VGHFYFGDEVTAWSRITSALTGEHGSNDIDHALSLKPDYVEALLTRAEYRVFKRELPAALLTYRQ
jgi:hypothetical protein